MTGRVRQSGWLRSHTQPNQRTGLSHAPYAPRDPPRGRLPNLDVTPAPISTDAHTKRTPWTSSPPPTSAFADRKGNVATDEAQRDRDGVNFLRERLGKHINESLGFSLVKILMPGASPRALRPRR